MACSQSGRFGGRLDGVGGRLCDDDGCDLSIGSSQSTPVYSLQFPTSQSQSSLVPPSAQLYVCRSCPVSLAAWLPCWATRTCRSSSAVLYLQPVGRLGLPSQTCSRFSYGCATERINLCKHPQSLPSGLVSVSRFPSEVSMRPDRRGESWTSKTPETGSRLTVA